ncbi:MAG: HEPN domain-containing protein [Terriglobia bacterium]
MMQAQRNLLAGARESLSAAQLLHQAGHHGFAASRAYYAMFYVAEAFLLGKGLAFSKHSAVHAAFGEHFVRTGILPAGLHRALIHGMEVRQTGDYDYMNDVSPEEAEEQIMNAEKFLDAAAKLLGSISHSDSDEP